MVAVIIIITLNLYGKKRCDIEGAFLLRVGMNAMRGRILLQLAKVVTHIHCKCLAN